MIDGNAKDEVLDYLDENGKYLSTDDSPMNIRTFQKSIKLKATGENNWKELIARYAS